MNVVFLLGIMKRTADECLEEEQQTTKVAKADDSQEPAVETTTSCPEEAKPSGSIVTDLTVEPLDSTKTEFIQTEVVGEPVQTEVVTPTEPVQTVVVTPTEPKASDAVEEVQSSVNSSQETSNTIHSQEDDFPEVFPVKEPETPVSACKFEESQCTSCGA